MPDRGLNKVGTRWQAGAVGKGMTIGASEGGRHLWLLAALGCAIPLLLPSIPPLIDLYGHVARYHVLAELGSNPFLDRYYDAEWRPIGNLGVDLLVIPLSKLIGLSAAVKLVVGAIPVLTALGILQLSRAVHGRISPLALLAVPLSFNSFFAYGFVNFCLGQALVLLVLAWWLRGGADRSPMVEGALLGCLGLIVWTAHLSAWGALVIALGAFELARLMAGDKGRAALLGAAVRLLPLGLPLLVMLMWPGPAHTGPLASDFFDWGWKLGKAATLLSDPMGLAGVLTPLTLASVAVAAVAFGAPQRNFPLLLAAGLMWLAVALLPDHLMGSNLADVRLSPLALILTLVAFDPTRNRPLLLALAAAFLLGRLAVTTWHYHEEDRKVSTHLPLLDLVPRGSSVLTLYGRDCNRSLPGIDRLSHFGALVTWRRDAFTNNGFPEIGTPLRVSFPAAGPWKDIYHYQVRPAECLPASQRSGNPRAMTTEQALASFPRDAFDHVLLVRPLAAPAAAFAGLTMIEDTGEVRLYRVDRLGR